MPHCWYTWLFSLAIDIISLSLLLSYYTAFTWLLLLLLHIISHIHAISHYCIMPYYYYFQSLLIQLILLLLILPHWYYIIITIITLLLLLSSIFIIHIFVSFPSATLIDYYWPSATIFSDNITIDYNIFITATLPLISHCFRCQYFHYIVLPTPDTIADTPHITLILRHFTAIAITLSFSRYTVSIPYTQMPLLRFRY